jgi:uncharacterized protein YbjT (DUF2867 family)
MTAHSRVLVVGGSRGVGRLTANQALAEGYQVRVLAREPNRAAAGLDPGVEIVSGDLVAPDTLPSALAGCHHMIFTAGVASGRYAPERRVRAVDYQGLVDTLAAARRARLPGRFVYLNSQGVETWSISRGLLNLLKRNALIWRRRAEVEVRKCGLDYAVVRVPFLVDAPPGTCPIKVSQGALPLSPRFRIGRADAAALLVAALSRPPPCTTLEITWSKSTTVHSVDEQLGALLPDSYW